MSELWSDPVDYEPRFRTAAKFYTIRLHDGQVRPHDTMEELEKWIRNRGGSAVYVVAKTSHTLKATQHVSTTLEIRDL